MSPLWTFGMVAAPPPLLARVAGSTTLSQAAVREPAGSSSALPPTTARRLSSASSPAASAGAAAAAAVAVTAALRHGQRRARRRGVGCLVRATGGATSSAARQQQLGQGGRLKAAAVLRRPARLRDTEEAMEAEEFEDEKEAQMAVLRMYEEQQALQDVFGGTNESKMMRMVQGENNGTSLAQQVENILANKRDVAIPGAGPGAAAVEPLPCVAVCAFGGKAAVAGSLMDRLRQEVEARGGTAPEFIDLAKAANQTPEAVSSSLAQCEVAVVCPEALDEAGGQTLDVARDGLQAVLAAAPDRLQKVILLSRIGARSSRGGGIDIAAFFGLGGQSENIGWAKLEDELTSTARLRTSRRPLRHAVVRAGAPPPGGSASGGAATAPRCWAGDAKGEDGESDMATSCEVAAEALLQAVVARVDANFAVAGTGAAADADWPELLTPFVGPEVFRMKVPDARQAAIFSQQWAEQFFGGGKNAMRFGVKTPLDLRTTPSGVVMKFRPSSNPGASAKPFEQLGEGGLEFVAEAPGGGEARLRIIRCAYGWKVAAKETSEQAILDKFEKDWAVAWSDASA